jgi:YD repeat-containing protein
LTWRDGFYVTYEHLVTGEMSAIRENGSFVLASFGYDDLGRRTTLSRGNGTATTYGYDAASRLSSLAQDLGGSAHDQTLTFGYTPASQIASNTRSNDAYAWTQHSNLTRGYTANGLNQYTAAGPLSPAYDGRGNTTALGTRQLRLHRRGPADLGPGQQPLLRSGRAALSSVGELDEPWL